MKEAILTVGQRASGKSTFSEKAVEYDPSITLISRDKILISLFGTTSLSTYSGGHLVALDVMFEEVKKAAESASSVIMILDAYNTNSEERKILIKKLREFGFNSVKAWYFITPLEYVEEWFWKKPKIAKIKEMKDKRGMDYTFFLPDAPRNDFEVFHDLAKGIESDGFDKVIKINPLVTNVEKLFKSKASLIS